MQFNLDYDSPDLDYCAREFDREHGGFVWRDEHGNACPPRHADEAARYGEWVVNKADRFFTAIPGLGTAWGWSKDRLLDFAGYDASGRRRRALARAWSKKRWAVCRQSAGLRLTEEVRFLVRNGYGPLIAFVAEPRWLGFDSVYARRARWGVYEREVPPWGLRAPIFPLADAHRVKAGVREHVVRQQDIDRFEKYMEWGSGPPLVVQAMVSRVSTGGGPSRPFYHGGRPGAVPTLPREVVDKLRREVCSEHASAQQEESCIDCVVENLRIALLYNLYGKPLGDVEAGFDRIEDVFSREIAYLRSEGYDVGRRRPEGDPLALIRRFGRGGPPRPKIVLSDDRTLRLQRVAAEQVQKSRQANAAIAMGAAALLGAVWWKRRR